MKRIHIGMLYLVFTALLLQAMDKEGVPSIKVGNKFIVITDLEPDDRIALHVLAAKIPKNEILFVGTTVKNAARKKALARKLLDQLQLHDVPVYQGSGGDNTSYFDTVSSQAAREYNSREGQNILSTHEFARLEHMHYSSLELQHHILKALKKYNDVQFIILASPTDLCAVLEQEPSLKVNIKHIHIQGGWGEFQENGQIVLRTTYNWNMDPQSSAQLLNMNDIPMTLYSSHMVKPCFKSGRCNIDNSPALIEAMDALQAMMPSLQDQEIACLSWDEFTIAKFPMLKKIIEPYKGKQFTPADPLVIVGVVNQDLIELKQAVNVLIDVQDFDESKGFRVYVEPNPSSKINVVQSVNANLFKHEIVQSFNILRQRYDAALDC